MLSESFLKSQSVSQPSATPELESSWINTNSNPESEQEVVLIGDDKNDDKNVKEEGSRLRSDVWNHFTKKLIDGVMKAICKYCKKQFRGDSGCGTSHLKNHYMNKHNNKAGGNIRQKLLAGKLNKTHPELASYSFNHDASKKELAKAIVMHEYPLSIVEHVGFRRYSSSLQPLFKVPCRNTIKNEILQMYELERVKTSTLLDHNVSRIAITTDMWTASNQKKSYMAVTAHFIDDTWNLQSRIMRFIYVLCPHTKDVLSKEVLDCLMD